MRILLVTPAKAGTRLGNRVTALRWQALLRELGHRVAVATRYTGQDADLLVALHARRGHAAVAAFRRRHPERPVVVALTGTDVYGNLRGDRAALDSIATAFRLVALQPLAARQLAPRWRGKIRVIRQSFAPGGPVRARRRGATMQIAVIGHLRYVKDPLRMAYAARGLPAESRITVVQAGSALQPQWARRARQEMARNPRYVWRGDLPAAAVRRLMAESTALALTSRSEGGANVISEAVGLGLPVLASRIDGNVGLLGAGYPGYYPVGDTAALRRLLLRVERDTAFLDRLRRWVRRLAPQFTPQAERAAWRALLAECVGLKKQRAR